MDPVAGGLTRAAVWTGAGVDLRDVAVPRLGARELLVRVRLATVCGSDLHTVTGRRPGPRPSVLGHEAVGDVVAAGPGAGTVVGARIVWTVTASCGACDRCESGRSAKCRSLRKVGHEPFDGAWALSGAYARYIVLPAGVGVVRVPDRVDVALDFSGSTAAVGECLRRLDVGGRLVLAGSVMPGPSVSLDPEAVVRGWLTVTGVHNYEPAHLHRAVEFLARTAGTYPWDELVAEPVRLDDLAKALRRPDAPALRTSVAP